MAIKKITFSYIWSFAANFALIFTFCLFSIHHIQCLSPQSRHIFPFLAFVWCLSLIVFVNEPPFYLIPYIARKTDKFIIAIYSDMSILICDFHLSPSPPLDARYFFNNISYSILLSLQSVQAWNFLVIYTSLVSTVWINGFFVRTNAIIIP